MSRTESISDDIAPPCSNILALMSAMKAYNCLQTDTFFTKSYF